MDGKRHLAQSNQEAFSERKTTVVHLTQHCRSLPVTYLLLQVQSFCLLINIASMSVLVSRCPSFVQGRHQACGASRQITGRSALFLFARTACGDVQPRASDQGDVPAVRPPHETRRAPRFRGTSPQRLRTLTAADGPRRHLSDVRVGRSASRAQARVSLHESRNLFLCFLRSF